MLQRMEEKDGQETSATVAKLTLSIWRIGQKYKFKNRDKDNITTNNIVIIKHKDRNWHLNRRKKVKG